MTAKTPTRILFVHNNNDLYGADIALLTLLKRLNRTRFEPLVVLPTDTRHINRLSTELDKIGVECGFLPIGVLRRRYLRRGRVFAHAVELAGAVWSLSRLIRKRRIDLVHSNTLQVVAGAGAALFTRRPHIWHVHELLVDPSWLRRTLHWMVPRCSTVVVANSEAVRQHLLVDAASYRDRIQVILNGIDTAAFGGNAGRDEIRKEWGVAPGETLIGMIGKVTRWKGQLAFAGAARLVLDTHPGTKFAAVGGVFDDETHFMDRFCEEVERMGLGDSLIISDFRSDVPQVLHAFDIFVLPSTWPEPFGLVVTEAMAAGKPVVATAHGGPTEIVAAGETGYLVPPGDAQALADAIRRFLDDRTLIQRMGLAGQRRADERFDVSRYVREFENLYQTVEEGDSL